MKPEIFQIFYAPEQLARLDAAFTPFDNSASPEAHFYEFGVIRRHYLEGKHRGKLSGYVSWKFGMKTRISGEEFVKWIERNPGYDLYCINPFPEEIRFSSVWRHGESCHPGIMELSGKVVKQAHPNIDITRLTNTPKQFSFCNYWVGTERFWESYMKFSLPVFDILTRDLGPDDERRLWSPSDAKSGSPLFPFVTERLLSTLLTQNPPFRWLNFTPRLSTLLAKTTLKRSVKIWVRHKLNLKNRECELSERLRKRQQVAVR